MTTDPTTTDHDNKTTEHQYAIDHRFADINTKDDNGYEFDYEDHVTLEFDEQGYGPNARIVRRVVGPWEEAQRDEDGVICDWMPSRDWSEVTES